MSDHHAHAPKPRLRDALASLVRSASPPDLIREALHAAVDLALDRHASVPTALAIEPPCCDDCAKTGGRCVDKVPAEAPHTHAVPVVARVEGHAPLTPSPSPENVAFLFAALRGEVTVAGFKPLTLDDRVVGLLHADQAAVLREALGALEESQDPVPGPSPSALHGKMSPGALAHGTRSTSDLLGTPADAEPRLSLDAQMRLANAELEGVPMTLDLPKVDLGAQEPFVPAFLKAQPKMPRQPGLLEAKLVYGEPLPPPSIPGAGSS